MREIFLMAMLAVLVWLGGRVQDPPDPDVYYNITMRPDDPRWIQRAELRCSRESYGVDFFAGSAITVVSGKLSKKDAVLDLELAPGTFKDQQGSYRYSVQPGSWIVELGSSEPCVRRYHGGTCLAELQKK